LTSKLRSESKLLVEEQLSRFRCSWATPTQPAFSIPADEVNCLRTALAAAHDAFGQKLPRDGGSTTELWRAVKWSSHYQPAVLWALRSDLDGGTAEGQAAVEAAQAAVKDWLGGLGGPVLAARTQVWSVRFLLSGTGDLGAAVEEAVEAAAQATAAVL
jgi:hypothetical protein